MDAYNCLLNHSVHMSNGDLKLDIPNTTLDVFPDPKHIPYSLGSYNDNSLNVLPTFTVMEVPGKNEKIH